MKITRIDLHVLLVPDYDAAACSSAQDDLVVEVHTDEGLVGIGETDTNPWVARECIRARGTHCMGRGLEEMLIGADPMQPEAVWETLYRGSKMTGRRGRPDLCHGGDRHGPLGHQGPGRWACPSARLLGGGPHGRSPPMPRSCPTGRHARGLRRLRSSTRRSGRGGWASGPPSWRSASTGLTAINGLQESDDAVVEIVAECRRAVGPDLVLMVDVAYAWPDARTALGVIERLAPFDLAFIETPIDIDDLEGYAFLHDRSPIPIAAGEWQNTHFEFLDLADRGKVDVLQPDVGRVGGLTEALRVCRIAAERGLRIVPHCWKSGIGIAASAHLAAASECCPYIEFLPVELAESPLRRELLVEDLPVVDGRIRLPDRPGLGIALNRDALEQYRVDGRVYAPPRSARRRSLRRRRRRPIPAGRSCRR